MKTARLSLSPLADADIDALADLLWDARVYEHIGGLPSGADQVALGLRIALLGPPADRASERWLNYAVRLRESHQLIGRLEATVHDGVAEVAFLLGPSYWAHGYAAEGLAWLQDELSHLSPEVQCWATTLPANVRSSRLLTACGYERVDPVEAPDLMTYDEGDWIFRRVRV